MVDTDITTNIYSIVHNNNNKNNVYCTVYTHSGPVFVQEKDAVLSFYHVCVYSKNIYNQRFSGALFWLFDCIQFIRRMNKKKKQKTKPYRTPIQGGLHACAVVEFFCFATAVCLIMRWWIGYRWR